MEKVYIGRISTTHGIKGELKVKSDFKYKDEVFVKDMVVNVSNLDLTISSARNQMEDKLISFYGYDSIDDVIKFRGADIYIDRSLINNNYILNEDIIGFDVFVGDKNIGKLTSILKTNAHDILVVDKIMIPYVDAYIKQIDIDNEIIYVNEIEGLI